MKTVALFLLHVYKVLISPALHQLLGVRSACRYSPTCSEYARIAIIKYGVVKGGYISLRRLLSCQPFGDLKKKY